MRRCYAVDLYVDLLQALCVYFGNFDFEMGQES
jgi:hypothetical protein